MSYEPERELVPGASGEMLVQRPAEGGGTRQVIQSGRIDPRTLAQLAKSNFGVDKIERLEGNIGYLKISRFVPTDLSRETLRAAIGVLAHSDAVIVDLRGNPGGAPDAVGELLSPFFAADAGPIELHSAENRAMGIKSTIATDPSLSRPALVKAPLYVLTDARTGSAAEMFAYLARRHERATLVGATTAGAGNGAMKHPVGDGFVLMVSEWKLLSGPGWEGVGVKPDVAIDSAQALEQAIALARAAIAS